jgi:flagellar hook-length control protein FliK
MMMSNVPFAGAPMPVASSTTPAAPTSTTASSTAPASVAVDFMAMLGLASAGAPAAVQASKEGEELDATDSESPDVAGLMPLSLPVTPAEPNAKVAEAQAAALLDAASAGRTNAVTPEAQLVSDLIQPEQAAAGEGKFEIPQLPTNSESASALRQAEPAHLRPVHGPVGDARWAEEIGARMTMMVEQGKHTASLRLSPEHLGPLEVRITVNGDQASVQFGAAHVDTRNALENALPRLREMFAAQGLTLTDANVSREPPRQQSNHAAQASASADALGADEPVSSGAAAQVRLGLLDTYA